MSKQLTGLMLFCCLSATQAQTVTWSEDIAPIIFDHCTSCHRPGEIAPFPLMNYQDAKDWGPTIKYVTDIRYMPPWKADPNFGVSYLGENFLSQSQIDLIRDWVDQDMPQGDPNLEPPLPVFPSGSQVGTPDLVLSFAQTHIHPGDGYDEYRYFVLPTGLTEAKDLVALEMRPGNTRVVHHALFWQDTTGTAAMEDAMTPEYGYLGASTGGQAGLPGGLTNLNNQLPGYVPGQRPTILTNGIAQKLLPGSDLVVQVHYAPTSVDEADSSTVNLFFADQPAQRFLKNYIMLPFAGTLTNGPFFIPANQQKTFHGIWEAPEEISLVAITPHMHLLGVQWTVFAITPAGDSVPLINIPDWDFNWQGSYNFKKMIRLPQGSEIHAYASYDNTTNNPSNPNNPPQFVTWGESTTAEMYYLPISYLSYQPGDEDLVLEDNTSGTQSLPYRFRQHKLYPLWPNPAQDIVKIGYSLGTTCRLNLDIVDMNGRVVAVLASEKPTFPGEHILEWPVQALAPGMYCVRMRVDGQVYAQKLFKP